MSKLEEELVGLLHYLLYKTHDGRYFVGCQGDAEIEEEEYVKLLNKIWQT